MSTPEEFPVSDELLRQYMEPWYAAKSITIYRDIKIMAKELLERRAVEHGAEPK
jgi:hypothetical protein